MENTWNLVSMQDRGIEFRDNLGEMKQYSVGYPQGMAYTDFITNELQPQGVYSLDLVKLYPTYNEVMADLQRGDLDLAFLDGTVAAFYRKTLPIQDSYVFTGTDRFGFAFPKNSSLRDDFDNYLTNELGDQGLQVIIDKWMN
jgi:polar amino acid transport system substrate-binding protein